MKISSHRTLPRLPEGASEAELVARAAHGDGTAFETIMRRHNQLLFRTARSIVRNDAEAEDVVQESYLRAWRAVEEMSVEEVAQALEIPEATVRTRFFRARSLLRETLAQEWESALGDAFSFDGTRCDRITAAVLARGKAEGLSGDE
jgi:DNA-directed RNA polymerase specialized sigma24 family protein